MKVEVVQGQVGTFNVGFRSLRVCADTEVLVRFSDPRYDYLRYLDEDQQCVSCVWLTQEAYTMLVEFGIPETTPRSTISSMEYENWLEYQQLRMEEFEAELDEPKDTDGCTGD